MTRESTNETANETGKEQQITYQKVIAADDSEEVIDLQELFWAFVAKWKLIVILIFAGALIFGCYHEFLLKPSYQADVTIFITTNDALVNSSSMQVSNQLTEAYGEIIKSRTVLKKVINELGLDMTYDELDKLVDVTTDTDSHIITIAVTYGDPDLARNIANAMMNTGVDRIFQVIENSTPTVIDSSEADDVEEVTPSLLKFLAIGGALGLVLALGLILVQFLTDTTIKTEEDVQKYLDLPVLCVVPYFEEEKK